VSYEDIVTCGVVSENSYLSLPRKRVVFVLKDAYSEHYSWPDALAEETRAAESNDCQFGKELMWGVMAWQMARIVRVLNEARPKSWSEYAPGCDLLRWVWPIAMTNLKKRFAPDSRGPSKQVLLAWANDTYYLLRNELAILEPDVVICGGRDPFDVLLTVTDSHQTGVASGSALRYAYVTMNGRNMIAVETLHPSARQDSKVESFNHVSRLRRDGVL
jgi:predicted NBD/HSP70 family sugar kinase